MITLANERFGSLAQLNRASDYGSEGYRFESYGSHKKPTQEGRFRCLLVCEVAVGRFFQSSASLHPPFRLCRQGAAHKAAAGHAL